ncbi:MAG: excalibur calcium-binding domain-containing protein [Gammaproteobacteria bacterium]|nr:excalibur calcium-binding domain-containing protein [Gammaproteobacteria bacterium]
MRRLLPFAIVAVLAWYGWGKYHERSAVIAEEASLVDADDAAEPDSSFLPPDESTADSSATSFKCDGRTYCSQMTSCAEATLFIRNCPDTKMDGNNDGVPCESQWCE